MRIFLLFIFSIVFFPGCSDDHEINREKIIGVKVYEHPGDLEFLFTQFESLGINTLFVSPEMARRPGFISLADTHEMPVYLIIPTFYNPEALAEDSSLYAITAEGNIAVDDWVEFICPNRNGYRKRHLEYLKSLVKELSPAGVSIDFIRYFVFWETVSPDQTIADLPQTCFDDTCLTAFKKLYQITLPENMVDLQQEAAFILENYSWEWTDYKVNTITSYVHEITQTLLHIDPELQFNLHLVPWRTDDFAGAIRKVAGQDVKMLAPRVDYISPMCYSHMVRQPPGWIHEVVSNSDENGHGKILPSIQVSRAYLEDPFRTKDFREALRAALRAPSRGVIFWSWDALAKDTEKQDGVRSELMVE
jgi:hypothetical protein